MTSSTRTNYAAGEAMCFSNSFDIVGRIDIGR